MDTLAFMRQRWPDLTFELIIGSDNLASLHQWKDADQILAHHRVLVSASGLDEHLQLAELASHPQVTLVRDLPLMEVSSTGIRVRMQLETPERLGGPVGRPTSDSTAFTTAEPAYHSRNLQQVVAKHTSAR